MWLFRRTTADPTTDPNTVARLHRIDQVVQDAEHVTTHARQDREVTLSLLARARDPYNEAIRRSWEGS